VGLGGWLHEKNADQGSILNYFRAKKQLSSGVVEGLNNKAKLITRKSLRS